MNAITRAERAQFEAPTVTFTLNGREVSGLSTETILEIADHEGIEIPRLCYQAGLDAVAIAAPAWSRSRASASSPPPAAARRKPACR